MEDILSFFICDELNCTRSFSAKKKFNQAWSRIESEYKTSKVYEKCSKMQLRKKYIHENASQNAVVVKVHTVPWLLHTFQVFVCTHSTRRRVCAKILHFLLCLMFCFLHSLIHFGLHHQHQHHHHTHDERVEFFSEIIEPRNNIKMFPRIMHKK